MAEVILDHVDKQYPTGVLAVRDFNLRIADGELVVLVGPSASGKTTTLRLIAGLEEPTRGLVRIDGRDVNGIAPRHRNVAMVFQRHSLYPHLNVHDNLAFGARLRDRRSWLTKLLLKSFRPGKYAAVCRAEADCEDRILDAARRLELNDVLLRRPEELSGGQQQRAALGRALVRQPGVFLFDEPLSHLEPQLRAELRRELHLLHSRIGATMVYVTHDQLEAVALADRVVVVHQGAIQQADRPVEIYERPRNRFVAGFVGWPPMNLLDGRLQRDDGRLVVMIDDQRWPLPEAKAARYETLAEQAVSLGLRPEHIKLVSTADRTIGMEVAFSEFLGNACLIALRRNRINVTALVDAGQRPVPGQVVGVEFQMQHSHLFDRSTGANLDGQVPEG